MVTLLMDSKLYLFTLTLSLAVFSRGYAQLPNSFTSFDHKEVEPYTVATDIKENSEPAPDSSKGFTPIDSTAPESSVSDPSGLSWH